MKVILRVVFSNLNVQNRVVFDSLGIFGLVWDKYQAHLKIY